MIPIPDFQCGDILWIKQELFQSREAMTINGKRFDTFLLQKRYIVIEVFILSNEPDNWHIMYAVRGGAHSLTDSGSTVTHLRSCEVCSETEARVICQIKDSKKENNDA